MPKNGDAYVPVGPVDEWPGQSVAAGRWERILSQVDDLRAESSDLTWLEGPIRAAAYQSGAIEGLHSGDRGLTLTLIDAVADWQAAIQAQEDESDVDVGAYVKAGADALAEAISVATGTVHMSEAWIREVHRIVCGPQSTYEARLPDGRRQRQELPKGVYKKRDNHVLTPSGEIHRYAPATDTPFEMERLVAELRSTSFEDLHPVVQAAYAHHGLTHIHPFVDGNGRVARVVASVSLLRATSLPFFLFADEKERYFDALQAADQGAPEIFVNLVAGAVEDLVGVLTQQRRLALRSSSDIDPAITRWVTAVAAAERLVDLVEETRDQVLARRQLRGDRITKGWGRAFDNLMKHTLDTGRGDRILPGDLPTFPSTEVRIDLRLTDEEAVSETIRVRLRPSDLDDRPLTINADESGLDLACRIDELEPAPSQALRYRLDAWMEQVVDGLAERLRVLLGG